MIHWILSRPVAVTMVYLSVVILGVISYKNLSVEGQPETEMPQIVVDTSWASTSPEVVQIFMTSPIEEAAAQVEGVEELHSSSSRGSSQVTLKFNRDTDMEFAQLDLNERLFQSACFAAARCLAAAVEHERAQRYEYYPVHEFSIFQAPMTCRNSPKFSPTFSGMRSLRWMALPMFRSMANAAKPCASNWTARPWTSTTWSRPRSAPAFAR